MKIEIEYYNSKFTAEIPDDASIDDIMNAFSGLLVSCTFNPNTIKNWIIETADEYERDNTE